MDKLGYNDIEDFYKCFEEQSGRSYSSNLDDRKVDEICNKAVVRINKLRELTKKYLVDHPGDKSAVLPPVLTILLEENCVNKVLESFEDKILHECDLGYYKQTSNEHFVWAWTLITMSWTLRNLRGKVEVGSCHNAGHKHGGTDMLCPKGSKFHLDFYNECLQSFQNIIEAATLNSPKLIEP